MTSILIVDDMPDAREAMAELVDLAGYEPLKASSGAEALRLLSEHRPGLVLLDVSMPEMDGFTVLNHLRQLPHGSDLPVAMLTAFNDPTLRDRALKLGAVDYFVKGSIDLDAMLDRIDQLVSRKDA
ncbi:MAG: response regulator [Tepidisphaeraceae bacterium]